MENNLSGPALVAALDERIAARHLLTHPFYQAWSAGRLDREALANYATQYYHHVRAFPGYLETLAERSEPGLRALVEENLAEELAPPRTHPELWRDFAAALGVTPADLEAAAPLPGTAALVDTFERLAGTASPAAAVAALYAYESQVPEVSGKKIEGLERFYGFSEPGGVAYFAVHQEADVRHRAAWRGWIESRPPSEAAEMLAGADAALAALWGALDAVTPADCVNRAS
jgi:pyrroloquinoline-quinone synthase